MFKVEMGWGRAPGLTIMGSAPDGELIPVRYVPLPGPPDPEWRTFACRDHAWKRFRKVGEEMGWQPKGTKPAQYSEQDWRQLGRFDRSYEPEECRYSKQVDGDDARALSDALNRALAYGRFDDHRDGRAIPPDKYFDLHQGISRRMAEEFIAFTAKGPFNFSWDD